MKGNKKLRATTDSVYLAAENASLKIRKLPEIIRIRKDETVSEAARSRDVFKRLFFSRLEMSSTWLMVSATLMVSETVFTKCIANLRTM